MTKTTPAPRVRHNNLYTVRENGTPIAQTGEISQPAPPADTTAAADLLQAAKQAADTLNGTHGKQVRLRVREALLQAIAKATGAAA